MLRFYSRPFGRCIAIPICQSEYGHFLFEFEELNFLLKCDFILVFSGLFVFLLDDWMIFFALLF